MMICDRGYWVSDAGDRLQLDTRRAAITWGTASRILDGNRPGESEVAAIREHLISVGFREDTAIALAKSCPSLSWAELLYPRKP